MKFLIATNNNKKLDELKRILNPLNINVITLREAEIDISDVEENGNTFYENAFIKAKAGCEHSGIPTIADDSGLCVDALNGAPGIYSARYAGENATDSDKNSKLLQELSNVPAEQRTAHFTCSIVCVFPDGKEVCAEGFCNGTISQQPDGEGGFGYDPIFMYNGVSFGKLSADEKDKVSHRGNALREFKNKLKDFLEEYNADE